MCSGGLRTPGLRLSYLHRPNRRSEPRKRNVQHTSRRRNVSHAAYIQSENMQYQQMNQQLKFLPRLCKFASSLLFHHIHFNRKLILEVFELIYFTLVIWMIEVTETIEKREIWTLMRNRMKQECKSWYVPFPFHRFHWFFYSRCCYFVNPLTGNSPLHFNSHLMCSF